MRPHRTQRPAPAQARVSRNSRPAGTGAGRPLDRTTRTEMERLFGHDFGDVRVHDDATAAQSAEVFGARAYTVGEQIVFGAGEFAPESGEGRRVLAHELAHVAQGAAAAPAEGGRLVAAPDSRDEHLAEAAAERVAQGEPVDTGGLASPPSAGIHRIVDPFGLTLLTDAALSTAGLDVGAMAAADTAAAQMFVNSWGGPAALADAAAGTGAIGADAAAVTAAAPAAAAADIGGASTLIGSGALEAVGLDVGAMAAADATAAEALIASWGGPAAFAEAAGLGAGGAEAAALGGGALAAEGAAAGAGAGAAGLGAGAILPLAAAAAAGVAGGIGLDKLSNYVGQQVTGDTKGDYSISGAIGKGLTAADESLTSLWADPTQPAYTQTLGWKLANLLD